MSQRWTRRDLLLAAAALAATRLAPPAPSYPRPKSRLILLGTGGGPSPGKTRAALSQVVLIGDTAYVIDCGDGVARQLTLAGVALPRLRHLFITRHEADHNADYGNLLLQAWAAGLRRRVDCWGPPPLVAMTRQFLQTEEPDIARGVADDGRAPLAALLHPHEITEGVLVMEDADIHVRAVLVENAPLERAFAYRLDARDRAIVIAGNTRPSVRLIRFAYEADILVQRTTYASVDEAGRAAKRARVKTLVLSPFLPSENPLVTDQMWLDAARTHFKGTVVLGTDLMEL